MEHQAHNVNSTISPIKSLYRKTESLHQINHQEMPQIRRRYHQSIIQRPSDTTRHCVTESSRTDVSTTNDNLSLMSCSDGTRRVKYSNQSVSCSRENIRRSKYQRNCYIVKRTASAFTETRSHKSVTGRTVYRQKGVYRFVFTGASRLK